MTRKFFDFATATPAVNNTAASALDPQAGVSLLALTLGGAAKTSCVWNTGRLRSVGATLVYNSLGDFGVADQVVEFDLYSTATLSNGTRAIVLFNLVSSSTVSTDEHYEVALDGAGQISIRKWKDDQSTAGTPFNIITPGSWTWTPAETGQSKRVRVIRRLVSGYPRFSVEVDGVLVASPVSQASGGVAAGTFAGIEIVGVAGTGFELKNIGWGTLATSLTLAGPESGNAGEPYVFTVGSDGFVDEPATVTPNDGGAGGTFDPTTLTLASGETKTFTYTAASGGEKLLALTNNKGLNNPSPHSFTAAAVAPLASAFGGAVGGDAGARSGAIWVEVNRPSAVDEVYALTATGGAALSQSTVTIPAGSTISPSVTLLQDGVGSTFVSAAKVSGSAPAPEPLEYVTAPVTPRVEIEGHGYILTRHPAYIAARPVGYPIGATISYDWRRWGTPIGYAAQQYLPEAGDDECPMSVRVQWGATTLYSADKVCLLVEDNVGIGVRDDMSPILPLAPGAKRYWHDPDDGDDGNDGLTPETPKKTWSALRPLLEYNTLGHHIMTAAGGESPDGILNLREMSGPSADYPVAVMPYDTEDPWNEEVWRNGSFVWGTAQAPLGGPNANTSPAGGYFAILGAQWRPATPTTYFEQTDKPGNPGNGWGASPVIGHNNAILLYRCDLRHCGINFGNQGLASQNFLHVLRRSVIRADSPSEVQEGGSRMMCLGGGGTAETIVVAEDCMLDQGHWISPDRSGATIFERLVYFSNGEDHYGCRGIFRRCLLSRSSSSAFQLRAGGRVSNVICLSNPLGGSFGQGDHRVNAGVLAQMERVFFISPLPISPTEPSSNGDLAFGNTVEGSYFRSIVIGRGTPGTHDKAQVTPNIQDNRPSYMDVSGITSFSDAGYRPIDSASYVGGAANDRRTSERNIWPGRGVPTPGNPATGTWELPSGTSINTAEVEFVDAEGLTVEAIAAAFGYANYTAMLEDYYDRWCADGVALYRILETHCLGKATPVSDVRLPDGTERGAVTSAGTWNRYGYVVDALTGRPTDVVAVNSVMLAGNLIQPRDLVAILATTTASMAGALIQSKDVFYGVIVNGTPTGPIIGLAERQAVLLAAGSTSGSAGGLPLGAPVWKAAFDPSDVTSYAIDFKAVLEETEKIAAIKRLTRSAAAVLLGVRIDGRAGYQPVISEDGKAVGLGFIADIDEQENPAFADVGVQVGVSALVVTDHDPPREYERTVILAVRQQ